MPNQTKTGFRGTHGDMVRHLYVHVPFCLRRCSYCDFAVQAVSVAPTAAWLDAIRRELTLAMAEQQWAVPMHLTTLYIGGGTPSLIGGEGMTALRSVLEAFFVIDGDVEWTAEANPETLTRDVAAEWLRAGVNRISMGAQTFDEDVLRWMGRMHGADGPARAIRDARAAGITNVSIDLIFGLPARFNRNWHDDLERVLELEPEHVSLYGLTAEKSTPLGRWVAEGREALASEEQYIDEYLLAVDKLCAAGFEHYEVSNFARQDRYSRHNFAYWESSAYLGVGPGAHSYVPPTRSWNVRDWSEYVARLSRGESPRAGEETIDAEAAALERAWLGLRTRNGLALAELSRAQTERIAQWQRGGLAAVHDGVARLNARGWLVLDRLATELV